MLCFFLTKTNSFRHKASLKLVQKKTKKQLPQRANL